jgi:hypothetical protein
MPNNYRLVNPHIEGELKTTLKSANSMNAAKTFYKNLSEHFNNNIPSFYFTIQKGTSGNGKYYHFVVKESKNKNEVDFKVEPYVISDNNLTEGFKKRLDTFKSKFEQAGGKSNKSRKHKKSKKSRKDSSDSSDSDSDLSSSDDFYKKAQSYKPLVNPPLYYWWYDPSLYGLDSVFIPTFYSYLTPYIELAMGYGYSLYP